MSVLLVSVDAVAADDGADASLPPGWMLFDGGSLLSPEDYPAGSYPIELAIDYFTSGTPPVKWAASTPTVQICTYQSGRPAGISQERFFQAVTRAVETWSNAQARIGIDYRGDCATFSTWQSGNGINEIGWDDARNLVRSPAVAVTQGSWKVSPGQRTFVETDVVFDQLINVPDACFDTTMAHELGHVLGLGHSDIAGDLMFSSFDSNNPATCPTGPSAAEVAVLQGLYGVNQKPSIGGDLNPSVIAGGSATVSVTGNDPDGDALTYTWNQTGGTPVSFTSAGSSIAFTVPNTVGAILTFQVAAQDPYLHRTVASISVSVTKASAPPAGTPSLEVLLPSADGSKLALTWSESLAATEYRFCTKIPGASAPTCVAQATPVGQVTWDMVLGAAVENETSRVFTTGTRETSMQACNTQGCTAAGVGPHAGGLRWTAYGVDYDYFAMSFDVPGTSIRFTIAGFVNLAGPARKVSLYSGTSTDPQAKRILNCGNVAAGSVCIGLLGPSDGGHTQYASIVSERSGTPLLEHRVKIR